MRFETDHRLRERLDDWEKHLRVLKEIEEQFLTLQASEKSYFGELFISVFGKSVAEREHQVYASTSWKQFSKGLSIAHSKYNHEKRLLELKIKAYEAEYLTMKLEAEAIRKQL